MSSKLFFRRSAAFTIIEMAIAMVISSIVIGFCYYMYLFINRQAQNYRARNRSIDEYYLFSSALQRDVDRAELIKDTIDGNRIEMIGEETRLSYFFGQGFVVREMAEEQDTFKIKTAIDEVQFINDSLNLVEKIVLQTELDTGNVHFLVNKHYSADQIMKAEQYKKDQPVN